MTGRRDLECNRPMPAFLRWLLIDLIVLRILRHRRVRPYVDRAYPYVSQYSTRFGRRMRGRYVYVRQRRRLGCCSGCLAAIALLVLVALLLAALGHWVSW